MSPLKQPIARRDFLKTGLAASAVPFLLPSHVWARGKSPNTRIRLAFIGTGKQNRELMRSFCALRENVHAVAVCDVDRTRREHAQSTLQAFYQSQGLTETVDAYDDFRDVIARRDIDAVCIATPDHWHAIITIAALNAGMDVYCEKPLVHTITEAIAVMEAVKRNHRVLQTGSIQRSMKEFRVAAEIVRNGFIGEIQSVVTQFGTPGRPCDLPEEAPEPGLDWDRWLGPAPCRPYHSMLSPRGIHEHFPEWRNFLEYGGGHITDWGAHHLDIIQWALDMDESGPVAVRIPESAKCLSDGAQLVYANGVTLTHRNKGFGIEIRGSDGSVRVNRGRLEVIVRGRTLASFDQRGSNGTSLDCEVARLDVTLLKSPKVILHRTKNQNHPADFIASILSRDKPCAHEVIGARSAIVCNLLKISYLHGASFGWDPVANTFNDPAMDRSWLGHQYRGPWKIT